MPRTEYALLKPMRAVLKKVPGVRRVAHGIRFLREHPHLLDYVREQRFAQIHFSNPLPPPDAREQTLIQELRLGISSLPEEKIDANAPAAEQKWRAFKNTLRTHILEQDPREFRSWEVVRTTMGATLSRKHYRTLTRYPFWQSWSSKLRNQPLTYQRPSFLNPAIDGTTLYHAFNAAQFTEAFATEPQDVSYIIDFGGGYGSMCALMHSLGFSGTYVLFDWPEFLLLQKFYLQLQGVDISRIRFVSSIEMLDELALKGNGLLIATWSLSETSLEFRDSFMPHVSPTRVLIAYQEEFGGIDNKAYFRIYQEQHSAMVWKERHPFSGHTYLLGSMQ